MYVLGAYREELHSRYMDPRRDACRKKILGDTWWADFLSAIERKASRNTFKRVLID